MPAEQRCQRVGVKQPHPVRRHYAGVEGWVVQEQERRSGKRLFKPGQRCRVEFAMHRVRQR
jgi:hypothetical protein